MPVPVCRVLFVCVGNTCRSVLALYLARSEFGDDVAFDSAGIRPGTVDDAENATYTLKAQFGIDASAHAPKHVDAVALSDFDFVIALDPSAHHYLQSRGVGGEQVELWKIRDPWGGDLTEYDSTAIAIKRRLFQLKR